jgi:TP901 family phage tail tape measure protein
MENISIFNIQINLKGSDLAINVFKQMNKFATGTENSVNKLNQTFANTTTVINKMNSGLKQISMNNIIDLFAKASQGLKDLSKSGMAFQSTMAEMQAITGVAGAKFDALGQSARSLAKEFGGDAGQSAQMFTDILSRLGPELAETPAALEGMGRSVMTLSKTMGGDVNGAMEALTTSMLQYNVSLKDPIAATAAMRTQMNMLAQGAKVGSATVPQVADALKVAGSAAYNAGVAFSETNAAIQVLGKGGMYGAEAGTALRNVMLQLGKGRFLPKVTQQELQAAGVNMRILTSQTTTLSEKISELSKIQGDAALVAKFFGSANSAAAMTLLSNSGDLQAWSEEMKGSTAAEEQASIQMDTMAEKMSRIHAWSEDLKISMFNGMGGLMGYAAAISEIAGQYVNLMPILKLTGSLLGLLTSKTRMLALWTNIKTTAVKVATVAQKLFNLALSANPAAMAIKLIMMLSAAFAAAYTYIKPFRDIIQNYVIKPIMAVCGWLMSLIKGIGSFLGLSKTAAATVEPVSGNGGVSPQEFQAKYSRSAYKRQYGEEEGERRYREDRDAGLLPKIDYSKEAKSANVVDVRGQGIMSPDIPGAKAAGLPTGLNGAAELGKTASEAIATGGTKTTNITVNLKSLIEKMEIARDGFKESAQDMRDVIVEELTRALSMAIQAGG